MPTQADAIAVLKADHQTVEQLFKKFEAAGDRAQKTKQKLVEQITRELAIHAAVEELVFYPVVRAMSDELEELVLEALEEHHVAKWVLSELDGLPAEHERFSAKTMVLIESVRHHVKEEERELFAKVRKAADRETLVELGEALQTAKKTAPTHPHPRSPDEPPGNLANVVAGIIDRLRDAASAQVKSVARRR